MSPEELDQQDEQDRLACIGLSEQVWTNFGERIDQLRAAYAAFQSGNVSAQDMDVARLCIGTVLATALIQRAERAREVKE